MAGSVVHVLDKVSEAFDGLEAMTFGPTTADMEPSANHGRSVSVTSL